MADKTDFGASVAAQHGVARSVHWPEVEEAFKKANPFCICCTPSFNVQVAYGIQVHHIHPFHQVIGVGRPDLELDPRNLCSLCETEKDLPAFDHHVVCGHLGSFQRNNEYVWEDSSVFKGMSRNDIEANPVWQARLAAADKPFSEWAVEQKIAYRAKLDVVLPPDQEILDKYKIVLTTPYAG
jgi:hypothetical protein